MLYFGYVLGGLALLVLIPVFISCCYLFVLTLFSLIPNWRKFRKEATAKFAILLPVHNGEKKIEKAVRDLVTELDYDPELYDVLVIADNCTDSTAFTASFAGAQVIECTNDWKQGKGHALEWAFLQLKKKNYDAFLVIDIDTVVDTKALRYLDAELAEDYRALQLSCAVLNNQDSWRNRYLDVIFAGLNHLRPKGRNNLGLSCGISGNGFCIAKDLLRDVPFEAFEKVEGLEYHFKMVLNEEKVRFIPRAKVYSRFAIGDKASIRKEEFNRYQISKKYLPSLLKAAICGNFSAWDCIFELYTTTLKTIIGTLIATSLAGAMLFLAAISLDEFAQLNWLAFAIFFSAILGILMIACYIFAGILERKLPLMTWLAVFCFPLYLLGQGFVKLKNYIKIGE